MRNSILFAVLTAATTTYAQGSANIFNHCTFPVSLWAVDAQRNPQSPSTIAPGSSYSEQYHTLPSGGVSLKLTNGNSVASPITQFEYTAAGGFIWYDVSNVNCVGLACPFESYGMHMDTTDPSCPVRTCNPNEAPCIGAYTNYNDDWNSLSCSPGSNINLYLCTTTAGAPAAPAPAAPAAPASIPSKVANAAPASPPAVASSTPKAVMEAVAAVQPGLAKLRARHLLSHQQMRRHMHQH